MPFAVHVNEFLIVFEKRILVPDMTPEPQKVCDINHSYVLQDRLCQSWKADSDQRAKVFLKRKL